MLARIRPDKEVERAGQIGGHGRRGRDGIRLAPVKDSAVAAAANESVGRRVKVPVGGQIESVGPRVGPRPVKTVVGDGVADGKRTTRVDAGRRIDLQDLQVHPLLQLQDIILIVEGKIICIIIRDIIRDIIMDI